MTTGLIIVGLAVVVGLLLGWLLPKVMDVPHIPGWLRLTFLLLILVGGWLTVAQSIHLKDFDKYKEWGIVQGKILAARITDTDSAYRPLINYVYLVDGKRYEGSSDMDVPGFGGKQRMYEVADKTVKGLPPGTIVPVYFDPHNPADSRIRVTPTWDVFAQIGFGAFLILCALFGVLLPKRQS